MGGFKSHRVRTPFVSTSVGTTTKGIIIPSRKSNETCCRVSVTRTHMHACVYSIIISSSVFLGSYKQIQNAFTSQPRLHDACGTVCQSVLLSVQIVFVHTAVCTSTTVPLLPRRRLIRFGRHQIPRPLCLTESGRPACTTAEEARDALFATICYSPRISAVVRKTRPFARKIARIGISTLVSGTPNPQRSSNGGAYGMFVL